MKMSSVAKMMGKTSEKIGEDVQIEEDEFRLGDFVKRSAKMSSDRA